MTARRMLLAALTGAALVIAWSCWLAIADLIETYDYDGDVEW